jgi:ABC-type sugar transport system ATPase subunit
MTTLIVDDSGTVGAADRPVALRTDGVQKWYGATHALDDVSLRVFEGDVHAIIGENGAGKSTLMKIIAGLIPHSTFEGSVTVDGGSCSFKGPADAEAAGIFLVPQELTVVPDTTVADNLYLGREPRTRFGTVDRPRLLTLTREWIDAFQIGVQPTTPMRVLSAAQQQLVSIARAMSQGVKILILDEPTSSLSDADSELLFRHIREFHRRHVTTLYISHRMAEITRLADRITVMRDGRIVEDVPGAQAQDRDLGRRLVRLMVGHDINELYPKRDAKIGEPVFSVKGLTVEHQRPELPPALDGVDIDVRAGEVVGVFGSVGSGTAELAMSIFGALPARTIGGETRMHGKPLRVKSPGQAIDARMGYLTADRKRTGLVPHLSVAQNMTLVVLTRMFSRGVVTPAREIDMAQGYRNALRIKTESLDQRVASLSGGNQQKVVAAKWIAADPDFLILEEPTRGIDVGARVEIYALVNELAEQGKAVLMISSDLPELVGMADRVVALNRGRVAGVWSSDEVTQEEVLAAATGGGEHG